MSRLKVYEETAEHQDANILEGNWRRSGSHLQTLTFVHHAIQYLRSSHLWPLFEHYTHYKVDVDNKTGPEVSTKPCIIHDWGCGFGAATAYLQVVFPGATVTGYDYSMEVVKHAKERWPILDFRQKDIHEADDEADLIYCSHMIEHQADPVEVISKLRKLCRWLIVAVPIITETIKGGHVDAIPTNDWVPHLSPEPVCYTYYTTVRKYVNDEDEFEFMAEGTLLLVLQGFRHGSLTFKVS